MLQVFARDASYKQRAIGATKPGRAGKTGKDQCGRVNPRAFTITCVLASLQAKEALKHPYFTDLDKETIDQLENPEIAERDAN